MKAIKALIIVAALAIATFMIGIGKYNAQYADAHHGFSSHHAALLLAGNRRQRFADHGPVAHSHISWPLMLAKRRHARVSA